MFYFKTKKYMLLIRWTLIFVEQSARNLRRCEMMQCNDAHHANPVMQWTQDPHHFHATRASLCMCILLILTFVMVCLMKTTASSSETVISNASWVAPIRFDCVKSPQNNGKPVRDASIILSPVLASLPSRLWRKTPLTNFALCCLCLRYFYNTTDSGAFLSYPLDLLSYLLSYWADLKKIQRGY